MSRESNRTVRRGRRRVQGGGLTGALITVGIVLLLAGVGCSKDPAWTEPRPSTVFERYLMAWSQGSREKAYQMIDPEDRKVLEQPREELQAKLSEEATPSASEMLVVGRVDHPFDLESMTVKDMPEQIASGDTVTLTLTYFDEREGEATMVWRQGEWFVDLPMGGGKVVE